MRVVVWSCWRKGGKIRSGGVERDGTKESVAIVSSMYWWWW